MASPEVTTLVSLFAVMVLPTIFFMLSGRITGDGDLIILIVCSVVLGFPATYAGVGVNAMLINAGLDITPAMIDGGYATSDKEGNIVLLFWWFVFGFIMYWVDYVAGVTIHDLFIADKDNS